MIVRIYRLRWSIVRENSHVQRLVEAYGGKASRWVKKSGPEFEVAGKRFEYHWYEHHGVGRFETKQVRVG